MMKWTALLLTLALLLALAVPGLAVSPLAGIVATPTPMPDPNQVQANTTWAIYWYLCGSNLESSSGRASADLEELLSVTLSPYVTVVIETGGASAWKHEGIAADAIGRYVYRGHTLEQAASLPQANMGDPTTLTDFLSFCRDNYPADKEMVIFWDHGGGSCGGVSYDENFGMDYLSVPELKQAMTAVFPADEAQPPLELVGFDTCLMSTIDTVAALRGTARYMIGSEEAEPGCGWSYDRLMRRLAADPDLDSAEFGRAICDTYLLGCREAGAAEQATISLIDLTRADALLDAYEALGREAALAVGEGDHAFCARLGRSAARTENYGGNSKAAGYADMADLGDLVINGIALFPTSAQPLLAALDDCVLYSCSGLYRAKARGISCYYPYSGNVEMLDAYLQAAYGEAMPAFYKRMLRGADVPDESAPSAEADGGGYDSMSDEWGDETLPVDKLSAVLNDMPLTLDDDLMVHLDVSPRLLYNMVSIYNQMYLFDLENDRLIYLGRDTNLAGDWEEGHFTAEFTGAWGAVNGHICYMEPVYESVEYNIYNVPIELNGTPCQLEVIYDYREEAYRMIGAREGMEEGVFYGKGLLTIQPGDCITTLIYATGLSDDSTEVYAEPYERFVLDGALSFADATLPEGLYYMPIELVDYRSNSYVTDSPIYELKDDMITVVELE